jgi:hypothetical protein
VPALAHFMNLHLNLHWPRCGANLGSACPGRSKACWAEKASRLEPLEDVTAESCSPSVHELLEFSKVIAVLGANPRALGAIGDCTSLEGAPSMLSCRPLGSERRK